MEKTKKKCRRQAEESCCGIAEQGDSDPLSGGGGEERA